MPSPEIDFVIVETAINRPKPCDGIFNKRAELVILFNTHGIMDNMITDNASFVEIDDKIFLHSMKCIGKHTKKCDHCIKLCKNRSFTSYLEAMQIIRDVFEILESSEIRDTELETLKKFVKGCKLSQARCNEKRKLLAAKVSLKKEAITSL